MGKCTFLEYQWSTEIFRWEPNSGLRCGGVGKNATHWGDIPAEEEGDVVVPEMSKRQASKNRLKTWAAVCKYRNSFPWSISAYSPDWLFKCSIASSFVCTILSQSTTWLTLCKDYWYVVFSSSNIINTYILF